MIVVITTRQTRLDQQLPDQVDPEQHSDLLNKIGINPSDLLGDIEGKIGL